MHSLSLSEDVFHVSYYEKVQMPIHLTPTINVIDAPVSCFRPQDTGNAGLLSPSLYRDNTLLVSLYRDDSPALIMQRLSADHGYEPPPHEFNLLRAYPNPFNSWVYISYELTSGTEHSIAVYDIQGREVYKAEMRLSMPGRNTQTIGASTWSSGIYLARLEAGAEKKIVKLVCVK